jgi:nitrogen fixation NifU-like protein
LESLYQKQLLTLAGSARDLPTLKNPTHSSVVNNPICGDKVTATIEIDDHIIIANAVEARGCALCEAGAGLWMHMVANRPLLELSLLHDQLASWLSGNAKSYRNIGIDTKIYTPLTPVRAIKNRHKCVLLAFSTADKFRPL